MAHVQLRKQEGDSRVEIVVDGVDMSDHVYRDGFALVRVGEGEGEEWGVRMVVAADAFDIDLPDAVLAALVHKDETVSEAIR